MSSHTKGGGVALPLTATPHHCYLAAVAVIHSMTEVAFIAVPESI